MNLDRLDEYFPASSIKWKPIAVSRKTSKALAAGYVDNRAIMRRLDEVCGKAGWKNQYQAGPNGGIICGISIRCEDGWVTKWDGADNTDIEPVKGGLSDSMRRAAVQWGIGRYLYDLPQQWVEVDERGRFTRKPQIPRQFLPDTSAPRSAPYEEPAPGDTRAKTVAWEWAKAKFESATMATAAAKSFYEFAGDRLLTENTFDLWADFENAGQGLEEEQYA